MSLLGDLSGSIQNAGGVSSNGSMNWAATDASSARAWSDTQATLAFERQNQLMQQQMAYNSAEAAIAREFNRQEAQKNRDWQTEMANTIYTRSVKNMREAGINPILAANMGLSGANVGSGATASTSGATVSQGSAPLAQNFMDSSSAGEGWGSGSNWSYGESGLATGLRQMGALIDETLEALGSGMTINTLLGSAGKTINQFYDKLLESLTDKNSSTVHETSSKRKHGGINGKYTVE